MNLAIDIGNTSIKKVSFLENSIGSTRKIKYSKDKLSEIKVFFSKKIHRSTQLHIIIQEIQLILKLFLRVKLFTDCLQVSL